ncbi:MAG TPA: beta-ketoacyl synthase N-terminal-like domain-containing protein, partial [Ramlibacter sp.]
IDGWSLAQDGHWRIPGSPGLFPQAWEALLRQEGFGDVAFPAAPAHGLGQQVVVARSDGWIRQQDATAKAVVVAPPAKLAPATVAVAQPTEDREAIVQDALLDALAGALDIARHAIELDVPFSDYGVDSILGVGFVQQVNKALGLSLNTTVLFDHTTVARLVAHLLADHPGMTLPGVVQAAHARVQSEARTSVAAAPPPPAIDGIAVIGMSGQFPGARDVDALWRNMMEGVSGVVELPQRYLRPDQFSPDKAPGKSYCRWGGVLEDRDCFDPLFFSLSPREAESMNPHQRLVMQESWRALEHAGLDPRSLKGSRTGIFVGCEPSAYVHETFTGASDAIVASRLSYFLDLKGPAYVVNTGCSSSGVALHLACESLRHGETDMALAGGAFAVMGPTILVGLAQTDMLTHSGHCHAFDADADGMAMSEGVGMVALKRLADAVADGDPILGVIRASGLNQDGASNGITAPSGAAQRDLVCEVYRRFGIDPERISYVEAHGTGTRLGDPVEANALAQAYRQFTGKRNYCAVGSIKSYIGHTSGNAGVTGLISILLSMQHGQLPGLRNFRRLNPLIEFDGSAFYPAVGRSEWRSADGRPRMAALNSFGHSGTNVHLVVEEFVAGVSAQAASGPQLVVLSAKDAERLREQAGNLVGWLDVQAGDSVLADVAWTLQVGRTAMEERLAVIADSAAELRAALQGWLDGRENPRVLAGRFEPRQRRKADAGPGSPELTRWAGERCLDALAAAWVQGAEVPWRSLRGERIARRIHLPTYPFARERYWKPEAVIAAAA